MIGKLWTDVLLLWGSIRSWIYDTIFAWLSQGWYTMMLSRLKEGTLLLDIGIGNATALTRNADIVKSRKVTIHGVDIDLDYVIAARQNVSKYDLEEYITVQHVSIYDHKGPKDRKYEAAYFGASFMLLPDTVKCLKHVKGITVPGSTIYFAQTFQEKKMWVMDKVKPMMTWLTSVDFGHTTYEKDFLADLDAAGLKIIRQDILGRGLMGATSMRLIEAKFDDAK